MQNVYDDTYKYAIKRNLYEVAHALMDLKVLIAYEEFNKTNTIFIQGESFFSISFRALFNDMFSHSIKVLEIGQQNDSATFWYILKQTQNNKINLLAYQQEKIESLESLARKLKHVRDKTHFHIDKDSVLDPHKIWDEADIKGLELNEALRYLFRILGELYKVVFGENFLFWPEDYDSEDLSKLLNLANDANLLEIAPKDIEESKLVE